MNRFKSKILMTVLALAMIAMAPSLQAQTSAASIDEATVDEAHWTGTTFLKGVILVAAAAAADVAVYDGTDTNGTLLFNVSADAEDTTVFILPEPLFLRCSTGVYSDLTGASAKVYAIRRFW